LTEKERRKLLKREAKKRVQGEDRLELKRRWNVFYPAIQKSFEMLTEGYLETGMVGAVALSEIVWKSFESLRAVLEGRLPMDTSDPDGTPTSWAFPVVELRYPVEWRGIPSPKSDLGLEDVSARSLAEIIKTAEAEDEDVLEKTELGQKIHRLVQSSFEVQLLTTMTKGVYWWTGGGEWIPKYIPEIAEPPPEGLTQEEFEALSEKTFAPALVFVPGGDEALTITGKVQEEPFSCDLIFQVHPLVVDGDKEEAFFPIIVGLAFESGHPETWPEEERTELWEKGVFPALDRIEKAAFERGGKAEKPEEPKPSLPAPVKAVAPSSRRYLRDGTVKLDKQALAFVGNMKGFSGLPRSWKKVRRWEDLVQEETEQLFGEYGEEALVDLRHKLKDPDARGALLRRSFRPDTTELLELTKEAEEALLDRVGYRWFRRTYKDEDGISREYLVKRLQAGQGTVTGRFSWYGQSWPLVEGGRKSQAELLDELKEDLRQGDLFENLPENAQKQLDSRLRFMAAVRDASVVMEYVLYRFGLEGENPLTVPAWQFRMLLECENDPHGIRRIRGALRSLQDLRYHLEVKGIPGVPSMIAFGPLLSDVEFVGKGPGSHRVTAAGDFRLTLSETCYHSLRRFKTAHHKLRSGKRVAGFDWGKVLTKEERKELVDSGFVQGFSAVAPYWDKAKGFSPSQKSLRQWIESQVTLNRDPVPRSRSSLKLKGSHPDANKPRLYGSEFCPLLPEGKLYVGALGHFTRNPEQGRTLYGRPSPPSKTGGARHEGLLAVMGYDLPRGQAKARRAEIVKQALEDIRDVVETAFGGSVAARTRKGKEWLTLEEAARLPEKELGQRVSWFLFLPPDFAERMAEDVERHHAERYERGETPYRVEVTRPGKPATIGPDTLPLHLRLCVTRKERGLSQKAVGTLFGVSRPLVAMWETGPEPDEETGKVTGRPIPAELVPLLTRWVETGEPPSPEELDSLKTRRTGVKRG